MNISIQKGNAKMVAELSLHLPEFHQPYSEEEIINRVKEVPHLILVAYVDKIPSGFKVGYERDACLSADKVFFYSWLGGVLPKFRRHGIAKKLADEQERWALKKGYN